MDERRSLDDWLESRHPDRRPVDQRIRAGKRRRSRRALAASVLVVTAAVLVVAGLRSLPDPGFDRLDPSPWRSVTGGMLVVAALLSMVSGRPYGGGATAWGRDLPVRSSALYALTGAQRRALGRQALGAAPVVREDLPGVLATARLHTERAPALWMPPANTLFVCGVAVADPSTTFVTLAVLGCAATAVSVLVLRSRSRRAARVLSDHLGDVGSAS